MKVNELFYFKSGKLPALEKTEDGHVPLVYGSIYNNGVVKFVEVEDEKLIFEPPLITVSYLGTARVQTVPFTTSVVDKSNIIVLVPKKKMSVDEMYFYAFQINRVARFGFHYGRRMNMYQLRKLKLKPYDDSVKAIDFRKILPRSARKRDASTSNPELRFKAFPITKLFQLIRGDFHSLSALDQGDMPTVSRTSFDNGIMGYYDPPNGAKIYPAGYITVSTVTGDAFLQLHDFIATDNIVICKPREKLLLTTLIFVQLMLKRQSWRYSSVVNVTRTNSHKVPFFFQ